MAIALLVTGSARAAGAGAEPHPSRKAAHHELTVVPVLGGDSDVGFGGGYMASYARVKPSLKPYLWRVEAAGSITFKSERGLRVPYLDDYVLWRAPHVVPHRVELELRVSYTREANLKFYGLGNASRLASDADPNASYFEHTRVHPTLRFLTTYHPVAEVDLSWGFAYTQNRFKIPANGTLAQTLRSGSPLERRLLDATSPHGTPQLLAGLAFDTRDDENSPERGQYHTVKVSACPSSTEQATGAWAHVTAMARAYLPLARRRLTLAGRLVVDTLVGDAPFYELPRYDRTFFGGGNGIRGVPAQRYWGKLKAIANLELRSTLFSLRFWGKRNTFGITAFADTGRVWTELRPHPELDGRGLGLKLGLGGGLRWAAGKSFVIRADVAYSPDAHPVGGYLTSGRLF